MSKNLKKMISYYKPYLGVFWADMFLQRYLRRSRL